MITELLQNWANAVREKDIDRVCAQHADDILLFDVIEPLQTKGLDNYRATWINDFFPWYGDDGRFELSEVNVTEGADLAFATGILDCAGTENGNKVNYKLRLTVGLQKINDEWIVKHEHHSQPYEGTKP